MLIKTSRPWTTLLIFAAITLTTGVLWQAGQGHLFADPGKINLKQVKEFQLPAATGGPPGLKAYTIYMGRKAEKIKAAQRMNALHDVMASKGYSLHDVEPHWENSDLEGWWITYRVENHL